MKEEERRQMIDSILGKIKKKTNFSGIPIELWIVAETGKPGEPDFEKWLTACTESVDDCLAETGKKDRDSIFAKFVRAYGRREKLNQ